MIVRPCIENDSDAICLIYNYYISQTAVTFEETPVLEEVMSERIKEYTKNYPWLVLENTSGNVVGYAYARQWSQRSAYKNTAEISVYIHHKESGNGYGSVLYKDLLSALSIPGLHTVIATITLPHDASVRLHELHGFRKVSHFKEIGRKFNRWIDVGHWQADLGNVDNHS